MQNAAINASFTMNNSCAISWDDWYEAWNYPQWPPPISCLQVVALDAAPCFLLLVVYPLQGYFLMIKPRKTRRISLRFITRLCMGILLSVVCITFAVVDFRRGEKIYGTIYSVWTLALVLTTAIVLLEWSRGQGGTTFTLFIWTVSLVNCCLLLMQDVREQVYRDNIFEFSLIVLRCFLTLLLLVLYCWGDSREGAIKSTSPEGLASPLSRLTFCWLDSLVWLSYKRPLGEDDVYNLADENTTAVVGRRLQDYLARQDTKRAKECSFGWCLFLTFWRSICLSAVGSLIIVGCKLTVPLFIALMIDYTEDKDGPTWHGYVYVTSIVGIFFIGSLADQATQYLCNRLAARVRSATIAVIFMKALKTRLSGGQSLGEMVNLASVDASNLEIFFDYFYFASSGILHLCFGAVLCYIVSDVAMAAGVGVILLLLGMNTVSNHRIGVLQGRILETQDSRLKVMCEILGGIQVIKLYGWEKLFSDKVVGLRNKELTLLQRICPFVVLETFVFTASKCWITFVILVTYVMMSSSHHLSARKAYLIINYIQIMNMSVFTLPLVVKLGFKMQQSFKRLNEFLSSEELNEEDSCRHEDNPFAIKMEDASFKWEKHGKIILENISIEVQPRQLVAVIGAVGSGKSSLLASALGEMVKVRGFSNVNSTVAHVPQQAWIQNLSLRKNIWFGRDLDPSMYQAVIQACALQPDVDGLPNGDATEIGEKGINLSGGQKQRVSLARAVYSDSDIFLLDDPLSAVDSHVGKKIFHEVIGRDGLLKEKTRVLVTHGLQWLPEVDYIYVMEDGQISESGTFESLTASSSGAFARIAANFLQNDNSDGTGIHKKSIKTLGITSPEINPPAAGPDVSRSSETRSSVVRETRRSSLVRSLTVTEKMEEGQVSWRVYLKTFQAFGLALFVTAMFVVLCFHVTYNCFYYQLSVWADDAALANFTLLPADSDARKHKNEYYIHLLVYLSITQTVFVLIYATIFQWRHVTTSHVLHNRLLWSIIRAPISFFHTTPIGRILNRFSQDLDQLDSYTFFFLEILIEHSLFALGILVVISLVLPMLTVITVIVALAIYVLRMFHSRAAFQLKRLTSVKRSSVLAHFSETVSGLSVIRAHGQQTRFLLDNQVKIDKFQSPDILASATLKWVQMRMDFVACCLLFAVSLYIVLDRENMQPGLVGLILTLACLLPLEVKSVALKSSELDSSMVGVERILQYSDISPEAPWTLPSDDHIENNCPTNTVSGNGSQDDCNSRRSGSFSTRIFPRLRSYQTNVDSGSPIWFTATDQPIPDSLVINESDQCGISPSCAYSDALRVAEGCDVSLTAKSGVNRHAWPWTGCVEFRDFSCRYRKDTKLVLNHINFTIRDGEKIGVVGRTGAGKSSLVTSLFRLVEAAEGKILIDGVDISNLGLHKLRRALTILPQDPILFAGSIRYNLDPMGQRSDDDLWKALGQAHLDKLVRSMPGHLDALVEENGSNFSVGQQQLICLARTLLAQTRILVLDEATAAVDLETDTLVQDTIRLAFAQCTVIAIAHRISTVMDYDKILVLDQGRVVEFDSPQVLMHKPHSMFLDMVKESNLPSRQPSTTAPVKP